MNLKKREKKLFLTSKPQLIGQCALVQVSATLIHAFNCWKSLLHFSRQQFFHNYVICVIFNFSLRSCSHNFRCSDVKIGVQAQNLPSNKFKCLDLNYFETHEKCSLLIVEKREIKNIFLSKCLFTAGVQSQNGLEFFIVVLIVEINCCTSHHGQMH
jgi:hypothetical protein